MEVTVKPKHLIGNCYMNGRTEERAKCPLWEALESEGYDVCRVGIEDLDLDNHGYKTYSISSKWNARTVAQYIKEAEAGDTKEIKVSLTLV